MNYYFSNSSATLPRTFNCDTLEGNWYEDRCISDYDLKKKKNYLLPNPNAWQYEKTYNEVGSNWKNFKKTSEKFAESSDNILSYQEKDNNMFITTYRNSLDPKYKEGFRLQPKSKEYYKDKSEELEDYRKRWTKREQLFDTSYKTDILSKTASSMIYSKNNVN